MKGGTQNTAPHTCLLSMELTVQATVLHDRLTNRALAIVPAAAALTKCVCCSTSNMDAYMPHLRCHSHVQLVFEGDPVAAVVRSDGHESHSSCALARPPFSE
jgi:hypothetical protein